MATILERPGSEEGVEQVSAPTTSVEPATPAAPATAPVPAGSFMDVARGALAEQWGDAQQGVRTATEKEAGTTRQRAEAVAPLAEQQRVESERFAKEAEERRAAVAQPVIPEAPSRGLRDFLATSPTEAPEASLGKFISALTLFATGVGGLVQGDARASLAALTGAMNGWAAGDRARADRAFADWDAATKRTLDGWKVARQGFDDWLSTGKLSLDMRQQGLTNAMLQYGLPIEAAKVEREGALALLKEIDQKQIAFEQLAVKYEQIKGDKERADAMVEMREAARKEALELRKSLALMHDQTLRDNAQLYAGGRAADRDLKAQELALGKPTPPEHMKRLEDNTIVRSYLSEMTRLLPTVRLDKVVGGINPFINQIIQTGKLGPLPVDPKIAGTLTDDERRFLALTQDYADRLLRLRSGAAINESEFRRMLQFVPDQNVTPDSIRVRLKLADDITRTTEDTMHRTLKAGGYRAPVIEAPSLAPGSAPAPGASPAPALPSGFKWN